MKIQQREDFQILSLFGKPSSYMATVTLGLFLFCSIPISAVDGSKEGMIVVEKGSLMQKGRTVTITVTDESAGNLSSEPALW